MDHPDALERWLEHFDSMRGLPICIVDMPPAHVSPLPHWSITISQASTGTLWKRLLLGQGDGLDRDAIQYGDGSGSPLQRAMTQQPRFGPPLLSYLLSTPLSQG
jgi:hypothetical protein